MFLKNKTYSNFFLKLFFPPIFYQLESQSSFSSNNSFIRLSKLREDGSYAPVYKSEVKQGNANPAYAEIVGTTVQLANGDLFRPLKIECFEWLNNGSHKLIGFLFTHTHVYNIILLVILIPFHSIQCVWVILPRRNASLSNPAAAALRL